MKRSAWGPSLLSVLVPILSIGLPSCWSVSPSGNPRSETSSATPPPADGGEPKLEAKSLAGRRFRFSWSSDQGGGFNGIATLRADGTIEGIGSPNESNWSLDGQGRLLFKHADGRVSTRYECVEIRDGRLCLEGPFLFRDGIRHSLVEVAESAPKAQRRIKEDQAERIQYSTQRFAYLDVGEAYAFRLRDGSEKSIRLDSVEEMEDSVIGLARRAEVVLSINGKRLELSCVPYGMPVEADGLRIQVDTTSAWLDIPKRVQLSLWDASAPIVDADLFRFPLPDYRLFSHGTQGYNEPVHLGDRDGDPEGQRFYHNYGVDLAGYEGRQKVASAIDGVVVQADRADGTLSIEDDRGVSLVYGHLDSILSGIQEGVEVSRGQWVGMLGKRGGSGNFAHLHVGIYLSEDERLQGRMNRNINLYPWLVATYLARAEPTLLAVARPHHTVQTGETVLFDGSNSLASGTSIATYEWVFHDGIRSIGSKAERTYEAPGCYSAALWVADDRGRRDVDFARVKVFSRSTPEGVLPTLFATFTPAGEARVGDPVHFRIWPQGAAAESLQVDFGDGQVLKGYVPYSSVTHIFRAPGIHVVTASATLQGLPATEQLKVIVGE